MGFITGADCMKIEWTLLSVALIIVVVRIGTRLFYQHERLNLADWLLIVSAIDGIALISCDTLTYSIGAMDGSFASVKLSKISFSSNYFYDVGMGFPKMSMLAFYWSYFHFRGGLRTTVIAMSAFVVACYIVILFDDTFYCGGDVSVQWSQKPGACNVFYAPDPFYINTAFNISCYLVVYSVPVILMVKGMLKPTVPVLAIFFLGVCCLVSTVTRFATLETPVGVKQPNLVYPLSMLEMALAITTIALPGLKPLFDRRAKSETSVEESEIHHESKDMQR